MLNDHKQWLYNGGVDTGRIFEEGEEIPSGWVDRPGKKEWDNPPVQPVVDLVEETMVADESPAVMYCAECDKEYKDEYWYIKHMMEKHGVEVE